MGPRAGAENLAPTGIRSPVSPARSESLYRLTYPCPHYKRIHFVNIVTVFEAMIHFSDINRVGTNCGAPILA